MSFKQAISLTVFLLFIFFVLGSRGIFGQRGGISYLKNYKPDEYEQHFQNWWILQDKREIVYVGNNAGLLEFDGVSWRTINIPGWTARSMAMDDTGTIYVGGENEIGFLAPGDNGALKYVSLVNQLADDRKNFSTVLRTYAANEGIYFQSSKFLFRWDPKSKHMNAWKPVERFFLSFYCRGTLYVRQKHIGLMQMVNNSLELVPGGEHFKDKKIYMIVPYTDDTGAQTILIGTQSNGFYLHDGIHFNSFPTGIDGYIKENLLYCAIRLSSGDYALGTRNGGLVIIDSHWKLKQIFTKASGLQDDNIKYIFEDSGHNLWLALTEGISRIEYFSPLSVYDDRVSLNGLVLSLVRHNGHLYAGTTSGLFRFSPSPVNRFQSVPGILPMCWSLVSVDSTLLAAATQGVFQLEVVERSGSQVVHTWRKIMEGNSFVLCRSPKHRERIWVGTEQGLAVLILQDASADNLQGNLWEKEHIFKEVTQTIHSIVEDEKGKLWLGTLNNGVLSVDFPGDGVIENPSVKRYGTSNKLPEGEVHVFTAAGHVVFATQKGLFRFNVKEQRFIPDWTLGETFADGTRNVFRIAEDGNKHIWFHSNARNYQAVPAPDGSFLVREKPFLRMPVGQVNIIYPDPGENIIWFGSQMGLIRYDPEVKKNYQKDFPIFIRKVLVNNRLIFDGFRDQRKTVSFPSIEYRDHNLRFQFAAPFFEGESRTLYRFFLEEYDEDWSEWGSETQKDYTNLDSGNYAFRAQAKNLYNQRSREDSFGFKILPPWYKTWWAYLVYTTAAFMGIFFIVRWRSGKLEKEKQKLEQIVVERTKEINHKNQQLEHQTFQLQEQSEKLKEMDRVKSRFFANISHEFRTPLTLIMGPVEQMLSQGIERLGTEEQRLILRNSRRLLTLINRLLDLSRFDSGTMRLHAGYRGIVPFLKGIMASFQLMAKQKKVNLVFAADAEDTALYFDAERLEEVMANLLINALKFTPAEGTISVSVKTKEETTDEGYLEISVRDTGVGIPGEQLAHIFDRFYQVGVESSHRPEYRGTGIGLALTKEIISLHHGKIDVHSRVGEGENSGTEFVIQLPLGKNHLEPEEIVESSGLPAGREKAGQIASHYTDTNKLEEEEKEPVSPEKGTEGGSKKGKDVVLVVEDNADVRKYIRRTLEPDYRVLEAADGKEGITIAVEVIPDLIVSDIMMPGKDGYELCHTLKTQVKTSHIPIILLTAKASEENIVLGLRTGADDYITKPFNSRILAARVQNLIDLRRQMQLKIQRHNMLLPAEIPVSSMDEEFLKEFRGMIEKNLGDPEFNVEQLCEKLYMGRSTFFKKVQALTGETPGQFIQSYRLRRAAQLLTANFGNITQVAFEVGFSSTAYFTKCFKEKFHQLPSTYQASE